MLEAIFEFEPASCAQTVREMLAHSSSQSWPKCAEQYFCSPLSSVTLDGTLLLGGCTPPVDALRVTVAELEATALGVLAADLEATACGGAA